MQEPIYRYSNRLTLFFLKIWNSIKYGLNILWPFRSNGRSGFGGMMLLFNIILIINLILASLSTLLVGQVEHIYYTDKNLSIIKMICGYSTQKADTITPDRLMEDITHSDIDTTFIICIADSANKILASNKKLYINDTIHYDKKHDLDAKKYMELYDLEFNNRPCFCLNGTITNTPWHISLIQEQTTYLQEYEDVWELLEYLFLFYIVLIAILDVVILFINGRIMNKYKQIEGERDAAAGIQKRMVPLDFSIFPETHGYNLLGMMKPAKLIGGDLFDYALQDDRLYFCIGDVSGKGMPAALMMSEVHILFRHALRYTQDPAELCSDINDSLSDGNDTNMFCTFFVGIIDFSTNTLSYCNAGHNTPVLINSSGKASFLQAKTNIALGIVEQFPYESQQMSFDTDTSLVMYTDGVTEAESLTKKLLGDDTLINILNGNKGLTPHDTISLIMNNIMAHTKYAEQSDDITIQVLKRECQN